jgi:hypothetical protein
VIECRNVACGPIYSEAVIVMRSRGIARWLVAVLTVAGFHTAAQASLPVPYAVVGCISNGVFQSRGLAGGRLVHPAIKAIEGRTLRVEGHLSPGDRFRATAVFVIDELCREDLHKRYFLCEPCRTLPGRPHKMLPKQPGIEVKLPPEAIREFDNLGR